MDCAQLDRFFQESSGFRLCKDPKKADLIVFKGCSVNQEKEDLSCQIVKVLESSKRPDAEILVTGCVAKIRPDLAYDGREFTDLVDQINRLSRLEDEQNLEANFPYPEFWQDPDGVLDHRTHSQLISKYCHRNPEAPLLRTFPKLHGILIKLLAKYRRLIDKELLVSRRTFCIKVCSGCMGNCSYCAIKLARGRIKSKPLDAVEREFKQGLDQGYKDFALVGTDLGDYGKDLGLDLMDLLEKLVAYEAHFTLRLRNVNPRWLIPSASLLCELLKTGKIGYILSPVESGSNKVLDRMKRDYRIEDYIDAVRKIRRAYPALILKTQIMVGFPGETDEDFRESRDLFKLGLFNYVDVYAFTKRPRTKASRLDGDVPDKIVTKRYRKLLFRSFFRLPLNRRLAFCRLKRR